MHFRTRIFAISIFTVGAVLATVITLSWSRIMQVEMSHLDARLCMETRRIIPRFDDQGVARNLLLPGGTGEAAESLLADLVSKLRVGSPDMLMFRTESADPRFLITTAEERSQALIESLDWISASRGRSRCQVASFEHQGRAWRAGLLQVQDKTSFVAVDVAATSTELKATLREALSMVVPISLLLSVLASWLITSHTIRPVRRLQQAMGLVTQKDLSKRLSGQGEDREFQVLIEAYNTMLDRLENSFQQVSRFTADAAHELKTPLTVLRGKLEQAVLSGDASRLDLNAILDEVGQLAAITRKLLLLSQADSGSMALHLQRVDITGLLDELIADMELLEDGLEVRCELEQGLATQADLVLLRQLLNNLLVNVIRYALPGGEVSVRAGQRDGAIEVLISNACLPMSAEIREKLFDRFYRGEPEHARGSSGSGLGLSLSREIARAHGGDLTLEPGAEDRFMIRLSLPCVK